MSVDKLCVLYREGETGHTALLKMKEARKSHRRGVTFGKELARRAGWEEAGMDPDLIPSR